MIAVMTDYPPRFKAMASAYDKADLNSILPEIKVPTMLLYGEEDQRLPFHIVKKMHSIIPDAKLVAISDAGHVSNLEAPETFNQEVRIFLKGIEGKGKLGLDP